MPLADTSPPDSESDIPDEVPASAKQAKKAMVEDADENDDEEAEAEDVYQVEKIISHSFTKAYKGKQKVIYEIKWLGYDDEADRTWEPIENLGGAQELLEKYHKAIGGTPEPPAKGKKPSKASLGKRSASNAFGESPAPAASGKRGRKSDANGTSEWEPPVGSWEDHVTGIAAIIETEGEGNTKVAKSAKSLEGLLEWTNGRKTQHRMTVLRQKCPQRLLDYYESHLQFVD